MAFRRRRSRRGRKSFSRGRRKSYGKRRGIRPLRIGFRM